MPGLLDFDPLDFDPLSSRRRQARQEWRRPAPPEELQSFAKQSATAGLTGLGYVLSTIDKPGRAVRGLLGGKLHEALAAVPFSDTLGLTDPANAVSGAELNKKFFGLPADNSWKSWGAGLATEILADPLTYASFGGAALTRAGKTAKAAGLTRGMSRLEKAKGFDYAEDALRSAGKTSDEIAHIQRQGRTVAPAGSGIGAQQPLTGLARISVPGTGLGVTLGTGKAGRAVASQLDVLADALRYKVPGAKSLAGLFDSSVARATGEATQRGMRKYGTPAREAAENVARGQYHGTIKALKDLVGQGYLEDNVLRSARLHAEGITPSTILPVDPGLHAAVAPLGQQLRGMRDEWLRAEQKAGVPREKLADDFLTGYFPRQGTTHAPGTPQAKGGTLFKVSDASSATRKKWARDIPGGTEIIDKWSVDPNLAGASRAYPTKQVQASLLADMVEQARIQGMPVAAGSPELAALEAKAKLVARRLKKHDPTTGPLFSRNLAGDVELRAARHGRAIGSAAGFYGTVAEAARPMGPDMVPVTELLRALKPGRKKPGLKTFVEEGRIEGALPELHKALARQGLGPTEPLIEGILQRVQAAPDPKAAAKELKAGVGQLKGEIGRYGVTQQQAADIMRDYAAWRAPEEIVRPIKAYDSFTNAFRNMAYSVWLASHVRNLGGGLVQSAAQTGPGLRDYLKMGKLLFSKNPADDALKGELYQYGKIFSGFNPAETAAGKRMGAGVTPDLPGSAPPISPREYLGAQLKTAGRLINPLNWWKPLAPGGVLEQAGVRHGVENFPALEAGRRLGGDIENFLRGSQYLGQTRRGVAPAEAGREVLRTHFDYGGLTPFERKVMRRVVPFYTYMSRNLPLQLQTLMQRPGVIAPQLRLAAARPDKFIPSYLASGVAIPTGPEQDGKQQFISQLGLPVEEAFERLKMSPEGLYDSLKNTAMAYAGGLNPLLKGPLEQFSGKQFFSGRDLADLRPQGTVKSVAEFLDPEQHHPLATQLVSQGLANTPATRFLTAVDKLSDPRKAAWAKGLNLATGVRVTDVDMEKAQAIETRKVLEAILRSNPNISQYTEPYVRPEDQAKLRPEDVDRLQLLSRMQSNAQLAAKRRRQGI